METNGTLLRQTKYKPLSRRKARDGGPCPFQVQVRVYDITNTEKGAERLAGSEICDSQWRAALEGKILNMRVVRVERHVEWRGNPDTNPEISTGIEVTTAHGTGFVLAFMGRGEPDKTYEEMGAFVCANKRQAYVTGTWKKRGSTVGHFCPWADSMTFQVGRKTAVPRGRGKYVDDFRSWLLMDAAYGMNYGDSNGTEAFDQANAELKAASTACTERYRLRAAEWALANLPTQAA